MNRYPVAPNADAFLIDLEALSAEDFAALKSVSFNRRLKTLKVAVGWGSLFLGIFALMPMLSTQGWQIIIPGAFAAVFITLGFTALTSYSRWVYLGFAVVSILVALLIVVGGFTSVLSCLCGGTNQASGTGSGISELRNIVVITGEIFLIMAYGFYDVYRQDGIVGQPRPTKETYAHYNSIWMELARTRDVQNDQRFSVKFGTIRWIGFLVADHLFLAHSLRKQILFLDKAEVDFKLTRNSLTRKLPIRGILRLGKLRVYALMEQQVFERYQKWKSAPSTENNEAIT